LGKRAKYHVLHRAGHWRVEREGAERPSLTAPMQREAIEKGRRLALRNRPSQLIVHGRDGRVRKEYTYDSDPYPPEG